jgi:hypothetical protein
MAEEFKGINQETLKNVELLKGSMKEITDSTKNLNKQFEKSNLLIQDSSSNYTSIVSSASKFAEFQTKVSKSASTTSKAFGEQQKQLSNIRSLNSQIENLMDQMVTSNKTQERLILKQAQNLAAARDNAKELANAYGELAENSADLDKSTIWFSSIAEVVKDLPGLRKISGPFEAASKAARETVISNAKIKSINENISSLGEEALKTGKGLTKEKLKELGLSEQVGNLTGSSAASALKSYQANNKTASVGIAGMQAGFKALGPIISKALGPFALITIAISAIKFFVGAMFDANKQSVNLSKNLSTSAKSGDQIRQYFIDNKNLLQTQFKLTSALIESQSQLAELSALSNLYSLETLDTQTQLTKEIGLQAEDASNLNKIFITNDKQSTKALDNAFDTVAQYANQNKILFNTQKILSQASKTSGQLLVSFKGSSTELFKALMNANKLGISLQQSRDISNSLLDFESSISAEMEAELLTGKTLNLEKARSLALQGKFVESAEEALKAIGSFNEFQKMNVIQQAALAKAAGLTVDQLSDAFIQQKFLGTETGEQIKRLKEAGAITEANALAAGTLNKEDLKSAMTRLNAQEKFNLALEQGKEIFSDLVSGGALQTLADAIQGLANSSFIKGYAEQGEAKRIEKELQEKEKEKPGSVLKAELDIAKSATNQVTAGETASLVGGGALTGAAIGSAFPVIGTAIGAGVGALVGLIANAFASKSGKDDLIESKKIAERQQISGYEKTDDFILRPGQKPIKYNKDDIIIGGTNLTGDNTSMNSSGNNNEMISLLKELISAVKSEGNVYLDGTKVGTAMAVSTYRVQ